MRPNRGDEAGLDAALGLVVGLVVADGVDQVVPLVLVRVALVAGRPRLRQSICDASGGLALEGARGQAAVAGGRDDRHALGAVRVAGVDRPCSRSCSGRR